MSSFHSIFNFLSELALNNRKEWFDIHRKEYEIAKDVVKQYTQNLILEIAVFDKEVAHLQAKDCMFRINRDVRFSKNKAPYKTNMGIFISPDGKKGAKAGYYVHLEPGASALAGGIYMPDSVGLKKIRQEIDYNFEEFKNRIHQNSFKKTFGNIRGEQLKKAPKDYDPENPAIEYLKYKSFTVWHPVSDKQFDEKNAVTAAASIFKIMYPFNQFLNQAVTV